MPLNFRRWVLRADSVFLIAAASVALVTADLPASFSGSGPFGPLIAHERALGIGFVEAHGLAIILGVLLWRGGGACSASWHVTGAAIHLLLGACNIVFWRLFIVTDSLPMGWITTGMHGVLLALQSIAAWSARSRPGHPSSNF